MKRITVILVGAVMLVGQSGVAGGAAEDNAPSPAAIRAAVAKSLPLLESSARISMEKRRQCFTCHNTALPVFALTTAREYGFAVAEDAVEQQVQFTAGFLAKNRTNYLAGKGQGGQALTAGYALWTLENGGRKPDDTTAAVAQYLLKWQTNLPHWKVQTVRPPTEESLFTVSYVALRGLKTFGTAGQHGRVTQRFATVREWALKTPAHSTEDHVFRLRLLRVADAPEADTRDASEKLRQLQRDDGGGRNWPT
ncbi:MAG: hypothetical protein HC841_02665 [Verrucomicrobiae bacterium]|nr:hypothetical protein [Verrucomicrobiae bacterium]